MSELLIGHTGFVGGNLLRQHAFDACFNSKNIEDIRGRECELLVCSGAPAEKWKANSDPAGDLAVLQRLMDSLAQVRARRCVLISTVDVYPTPTGVDEDTLVPAEEGGAYGRNRRLLETFVQQRFDTLVVRLPGLFGQGLKKNVIYDFLHDNRLEAINADASFQFYDLANVWRDIQTALAARLQVVNFATEPVSVRELAREAFGRTFDQRQPGPAARYDFRSKHAAHFGGRDGYLYDRHQVLQAMRAFVSASREGSR
jgi:nucleoside-diphosphate-sugar epimerase